MSRLRAETMPAVTVEPRPNGLPIAITQSPMRAVSESPNFAAGSGFFGVTLSSARSVFSSRPISLAGSVVPSLQRHRDLVGVLDDVIVGHDEAGRIDDEARAERGDVARQRCGLAPRKSLNRSASGEPGGMFGRPGVPAPAASASGWSRC